MVAVGEEGEGEEERWGPWEELILGGAIQRHGTHHWEAVAAELQQRTLYPFNFTPQVCKAKYEHLQRCYSGYTSWFEELKKRRVADLKKALEKSENLIGSLELKLETLKAEKTCSNLDYSSNHAYSPIPFQKFEGDESFGKETSKDGLSAGSFTEETQPNPSAQCQLKVKVLEDKVRTQPSISDALQGENFPCMVKLSEAMRLERGFKIRKKRGERRRKDWDAKDASVGENNLMCSSNAEAKNTEQLASDGDPLFVESSSHPDDKAQCPRQEGLDNLMLVLNTVLEDEQASIFQRRMDGQKRARYRKLIRQHMDFNTIRSRIANKLITTLKELSRDLLLLANNALVFYSKTTREYKCGLALRELVTRKLWQKDEAAGKKVRMSEKPLLHKPPIKRKVGRPFNNGLSSKVVSIENGASDAIIGGVSQRKNDDSSVVVASTVHPGRRGKVGRGKRGSVGVQAKASAPKMRKKPRTAN